MPSQLFSAPSGEPLSLSETKAHLRVDISDDDTLIQGLIVASRQQAEMICRRALVSQQWKAVFDQFPRPNSNIGSANWYGPQWGISPGPLTMATVEGKTGYEIFLPLPPLQTVDQISYIDQDGATQTLNSSDYIVDTFTEPARVVPAYNTVWPATRNQINAVTVKFTCGYGEDSDVPQAIKQWMLLKIAAMYENREADVVMQRAVMLNMPFVDGLLEPYRVLSY